MPSVFISHSSKDKAFARHLATEMRRCGVQVWFDEWDIRVGSAIHFTLTEGIDKSDFVVVVLTPAALESPWVEREWRYACTRESEGKDIAVIPVLLEICVLPLPLREKKYADFTGSQSDGFFSLMQAISPLELCHREYSFLEGRRAHIGRRGFSVTEGPQRIMTLCCGGDGWAVVALLETVGPRDAALQASGLAIDVMHKYLKELSGELDPEYMMHWLVVSADSVIRLVREERKLRETDLGAKCAMVVQTRGSIHLLSLGKSSALCRWSDGDKTCYMRVSSQFNCRLQANVINPGFSFDHPIGFFADDQLQFGVRQGVFRASGDVVILTSQPLPNDEQGLTELCQSIDGLSDGKDLVLRLCRNYSPPVDDYMAVAFQRS
jgi:hypothetical protein